MAPRNCVIFILAALLVLGCISGPETVTTTTVREITVTTLPPATLLPQKEVDSIKQAIDTMDLSKCEPIGDVRLRSLCLSNVAQELKDPAPCAKITEPDVQAICYHKISKETSDKSLCEKIAIEAVRSLCLSQ
ncbi:MAG: hypothetical protein V1875_04645 [Candidatus Altiarchaeota archaeon]